MSAFVVSRETINAVCAGFDTIAKLHSRSFIPSEEYDALGAKLWAMNVDAVAVRYRGRRDSTGADFRYRPAKYSLAQQFKSAQCLLYQCSEGDEIEGRDDYKRLEAIVGDLAKKFNMDSPEYEAAGWGEVKTAPPAQRKVG